MSASIYAGYLSFSAAEGRFGRPSMSYGAFGLIGATEDASASRFRGLGGADVSGCVVYEPAGAVPRSVLIQAPAAWPVDMSGTLPGTMAGKRPAPNCLV
jgi:hypothetical protein